MEYLATRARELEIIQTALEGEAQRIKKHPKAHEKEWIKYLAETEALLKKVVLKKMKLKAESYQGEE